MNQTHEDSNIGITSEITVKSAMFEQSFNVKPKKLLVGKREWLALQEYAKLCNFKMRAADGLARPEFRGMKIYPVDDDSYIGVNE